ncbi:MAG: ferredoxin--NADP reductase [Nitrospinae bacterium]|nr:ferredoxin--NADP reductase [Nitrospinota bacterium]
MGESPHNAIVTRKDELAPGLMILRVKPAGWELPEFIPGQFAALGLLGAAPRVPVSDPDDPPAPPDKLIRRAYSIASSSRQREYVEFIITLVRSGALTPRLFALNEGDGVFLSDRFKGVFTLADVAPERDVVMIATGTGVAPYMSMIRTVVTDRPGRRFAIIHGARHSWDLGYRAELSTLAFVKRGFAYLPVVSRPRMEPGGWAGLTGYVQDAWRAGEVEKQWGGAPPSPETTSVFLCGSPGMIEEMVSLLTAAGYREQTAKQPGHIHVERYW